MREYFYGMSPRVVAKNIPVDPLKDKVEMCFYQYLPIKMAGALESFHIPQNLAWIKRFIAHLDFCPHTDYIYVSAKHLFVTPDNMGNRPGWHSDGFGSDDINYIWADKFPTQFCLQPFELTEDHSKSLEELEAQALPQNIHEYGENAFVRIDRWNIHRPPVMGTGFRTFLKFSISKNQYNLQGNSHNYLIDYDWQMVPRSAVRNHPVAEAKVKAQRIAPENHRDPELRKSDHPVDDTVGKVPTFPKTKPEETILRLPGAFNYTLAVKDLIKRLEKDNVSVFPVMNVSTRWAHFRDDQKISLEWMLRDILREYGHDNCLNMNQSKPLLVQALVDTGLFTKVKANGVSYNNGERPAHVVGQKFYKQPVNCLWYVPAERRF